MPSSAVSRVSTTLTAAEARLLRRLAEENGVTTAGLIRRAIRCDLERELALRAALTRDSEHHDHAAIAARRVIDCDGQL